MTTDYTKMSALKLIDMLHKDPEGAGAEIRRRNQETAKQNAAVPPASAPVKTAKPRTRGGVRMIDARHETGRWFVTDEGKVVAQRD